MAATANAENLRQYKIRFFLFPGQILAFASFPNMIRKVKNQYPNFKSITGRCFALLNILIWIVRSILSLNYKKFNQKLYSNNLYIVDITCHFL